jgi:uncharacterized protein YggE
MDSELGPTGITVSGTGEAVVEPDTGFIDLGVQVTRKTVADAREVAARSANAVIASAKAQGVESRDIHTSSLSISPVYDYQQQGEPKITGYQVANTVTVRVRRIETLSAVVDAAAEAAGDDVRIDNVRFGRDDDGEAKRQARAAAMADATDRATQLAALAGVKMGRALAISETSSSGQPRPMFEKAAMLRAASDSTPIEAGSGAISIAVVVRFAIDE